MSPMLQLNCWIVGDQASQIFPVKIPNTESIGTLKEAIKDKNQQVFHGINAHTLALWKDSIPVDCDLQERLANLDFTNESQLSSMDDLLNVFPVLPPCKHLHIIIKPCDGESQELSLPITDYDPW